jgi:cytidylate kinase
MTEHTPSYAPIVKSAEHQMRQWALGLEIKERIEHQQAVERLPEQIHPFLTISREEGTEASEVARRVGQALSWEVLDRELLHYMAEQYHLPRGMLEFVDEAASSWLFEVFGKWMNHHVVTQSEYVTHLGQVVLMAAHHGSAVFVGRGTQFFLPRDRGLTVQIVAPLKQRIERVMRDLSLGHDQAQRHLEQTDQARRDYIQRYFHHDVTDAHNYDLVINQQHLDTDGAADLIVSQIRQRFGE